MIICLGWGLHPAENHAIHPAAADLHGSRGPQARLRRGHGHPSARPGIVFFAFIGFDAVSHRSAGPKNPKRDMPIGILGSLAVCTVLYVLFAHVLTGLAPVGVLPRTGRGRRSRWRSRRRCRTTSGCRTWSSWPSSAASRPSSWSCSLGQSRVFYTMSRDGLVTRRSSRRFTRSTARRTSRTCSSSASSGFFAAFVPGDIVGDMTNIRTLFAFILVSIGVWVMRKKGPRSASVPGPGGAGRLVPRRHRLRVDDRAARLAELAPPLRMAGHRPRDLRLLRAVTPGLRPRRRRRRTGK